VLLKRISLYLLLAAFLVIDLVGCDRRDTSEPPPSASNLSRQTTVQNAQDEKHFEGSQELQPVSIRTEPFQLARVANPGYVGPEVCGECHRGRLEECLPTSHFMTCRTPTEEMLPPGFDSLEAGVFDVPDSQIRFLTQRMGEGFIQTAIDRSGPAPRQTDSSIDLILGAGKASDEVYLSWHRNNTLWELPIAWVYATNSWGASGFNRHAGGDFARELTLRCFECHNTWFEHVPGTLAEYHREDIILGTTCERCHGPAREHVDFHRAHPHEEQAQHIVLPSELPRERLIEVCTQCHGNYIRHRGPALSYRPGELLEEHYRLVNPQFSEDDHVANQIANLRQSKCFQGSQMTCITCHDPHLTELPASGLNFNIDCRGCHQPEHCGAQSRLPEGVRSACTECHMRKYVKINVNFDLENDLYVPPTRRSQHRIEVDPIATKETLYHWLREQSTASASEGAQEGAEAATTAAAPSELSNELASELIEHWCGEAEQQYAVGRYRASIASIREALLIEPQSARLLALLRTYTTAQSNWDRDLTDAEHAIRNGDDRRAIELFTSVLQRQPHSALSMGKLGTLLARQGKTGEARRLLERVAEVNPDEQYGLSMLAWLALLDGDYQRSCELYERADQIEPFNAKLLQLWGGALMRAGRPAEALERYRQSLLSDPRQLDALRGGAAAALQLKEFTVATEMMTRAVQLGEYRSPGDVKILAELHAEQKNNELSRELAQHLMTLVDSAQHADLRAWARQLGL
jgi:tetratricopeptide (TPR) repeat protein